MLEIRHIILIVFLVSFFININNMCAMEGTIVWLAERGDAQAQFHLGLCYAKGEGIVQDPVQAAVWYKKAAEQGHAEAQTRLGVCYANGWGVERDLFQAVEWYYMAAQQRDARASFNLGVCYEHGKGVVQDHAQAVIWYLRAAWQGHPKAHEALERFNVRTGNRRAYVRIPGYLI